MWSNLSGKGKVLAAGIIAFVVIALGAAIWQLTAKPTTAPNDTGKYYDPVSGETVSNPNGQNPETYGANGNAPIFLGFSKLLGTVSKFQFKAVGTALTTYAKGAKIGEYSLDPNSIKTTQGDRTNPNSRDTVVFRVVANRKDNYTATVEYFDISKIRLYLTNSAGKTVFDSGDLDGNTND